MLEAEYLLCLDSDGQCDPKIFQDSGRIGTLLTF